MPTSGSESSKQKNAGVALYRRCALQIASAIRNGALEPGLILLEGPISFVFETSRATVRKAMATLSDEGLIERFDGRGFAVAGRPDGSPLTKRRLSGQDFMLDEAVRPDGKLAADQIIANVEAAIMVAIAFGHYRVDEQRLADSFGVSRPVAREVLWRLRESGLVEKNLHSSWLVGPVTAQAIGQDREVRMLLEPHALKQSAPHLRQEELAEMRETVMDAMAMEGKIARAVIEGIERDLHISCLRHFDNKRIGQILHGCRLPMIVDALFAQFIGIYRDDATFAEHVEIIDRLLAGAFDDAAAFHAAHLHNESRRTLDRLKVLSVLPEPAVAPYLQRIV
ncbi:GntR family transcriptional regulator [Mesorhizobium sp.]|uniref:GntR family transcriptional regulator n=1 Tax=Mesorhizobium sp. TaxID=1871066 RepID=UPI000FE436E1|nr:GntR family transcriptional regulator [Mesorhizobium sp.]RWH67949.1 MAG: GntR family transcriptional regulator [Mesorhizobium sp.]RWL23528.1 MAG: GntR family transcriptional regulator [Mesorhizobium sp.]RWL25511.1 MAG: GntR family transcriptional regulator [Mesorhizobium sp.]RWL33715.1 MAG: GntR family transcriptional regulator [Mesorhizobium sp.]RWL50493.1 MAG: GntR family transcriptional regulator [Mesorhizobium sp.]